MRGLLRGTLRILCGLSLSYFPGLLPTEDRGGESGTPSWGAEGWGTDWLSACQCPFTFLCLGPLACEGGSQQDLLPGVRVRLSKPVTVVSDPSEYW